VLCSAGLHKALHVDALHNHGSSLRDAERPRITDCTSAERACPLGPDVVDPSSHAALAIPADACAAGPEYAPPVSGATDTLGPGDTCTAASPSHKTKGNPMLTAAVDAMSPKPGAAMKCPASAFGAIEPQSSPPPVAPANQAAALTFLCAMNATIGSKPLQCTSPTAGTQDKRACSTLQQPSTPRDEAECQLRSDEARAESLCQSLAAGNAVTGATASVTSYQSIDLPHSGGGPRSDVGSSRGTSAPGSGELVAHTASDPDGPDRRKAQPPAVGDNRMAKSTGTDRAATQFQGLPQLFFEVSRHTDNVCVLAHWSEDASWAPPHGHDSMRDSRAWEAACFSAADHNCLEQGGCSGSGKVQPLGMRLPMARLLPLEQGQDAEEIVKNLMAICTVCSPFLSRGGCCSAHKVSAPIRKMCTRSQYPGCTSTCMRAAIEAG
jgi:hypothetical protein